MLMRTDPFRDLDRLTQQVLGTAARPVVMPMDAWRDGEEFVVEFDLPGVAPDSLDLDVERNVVTVRAAQRGAASAARGSAAHVVSPAPAGAPSVDGRARGAVPPMKRR